MSSAKAPLTALVYLKSDCLYRQLFKSRKTLAVLPTAKIDQALQSHYVLSGIAVDKQPYSGQGNKINQSINKNIVVCFP